MVKTSFLFSHHLFRGGFWVGWDGVFVWGRWEGRIVATLWLGCLLFSTYE